MIRREQIALISFAWVVHLASCSTGAGDGKVFGAVHLPSCGIESDDYDMEIDFFAADYFDNSLTIRLQHTGQEPTFSDGVILVIRDVEKIAESVQDINHDVSIEPSIETFIENGPDAGEPTYVSDNPAEVALYLNETCPGNRLAFSNGAGSFTMESIYVPGEQKRIKGSFHFEFIDHRYWKSPDDFGPYADILGEFDFNYTRGKPAQVFP
ncbi:MAG: hypothetical protein GY847_09270 [Proteobacteria bacterium]|nr:hypothetical protein [Pseudomonadota bacterium]